MFDELDNKPKKRGRKKSIEWLRTDDEINNKIILAYECDRLTYDEAKNLILEQFIELRNNGKNIVLLKKSINIDSIISGIIKEKQNK
ncbi:MAG: hypothetical protein Unbinned706contig1001_14 [Prokaryotic dsDNA virus sp.]|nr:MAG: hypothetical protein Unbinned706contig1001_14 [Prokaryotic dsDNA virus sp.]|tara:strand:- start:13332 stop:13592 length:261 start_codon:yes stop_codon:yes gene_type:complete